MSVFDGLDLCECSCKAADTDIPRLRRVPMSVDWCRTYPTSSRFGSEAYQSQFNSSAGNYYTVTLAPGDAAEGLSIESHAKGVEYGLATWPTPGQLDNRQTYPAAWIDCVYLDSAGADPLGLFKPWADIFGGLYTYHNRLERSAGAHLDDFLPFDAEPCNESNVPWLGRHVSIPSVVAYHLGQVYWKENLECFQTPTTRVFTEARSQHLGGDLQNPANWSAPVSSQTHTLQPFPTFETGKHSFEVSFDDLGDGSLIFAATATKFGGNQDAGFTAPTNPAFRGSLHLFEYWWNPGIESTNPEGWQVTGSIWQPLTTLGYIDGMSGLHLFGRFPHPTSTNPNSFVTHSQFYQFPQWWDGVSPTTLLPTACTHEDTFAGALGSQTKHFWGVPGNVNAAHHPAFPSSVSLVRLG